MRARSITVGDARLPRHPIRLPRYLVGDSATLFHRSSGGGPPARCAAIRLPVGAIASLRIRLRRLWRRMSTGARRGSRTLLAYLASSLSVRLGGLWPGGLGCGRRRRRKLTMMSVWLPVGRFWVILVQSAILGEYWC